LIEDESLAEVGPSVLEYGVYLQVGEKTYRAVAVFIPKFAEAMYLPANTTVVVPLYGEKILLVPVEETEPPDAVGYITTDKGKILFTEDAPAVAFAETDNYTAITKHPVQRASVVEKRLPPPRGLAPRPTSIDLGNQAARPETGIGEEVSDARVFIGSAVDYTLIVMLVFVIVVGLLVVMYAVRHLDARFRRR